MNSKVGSPQPRCPKCGSGEPDNHAIVGLENGTVEANCLCGFSANLTFWADFAQFFGPSAPQPDTFNALGRLTIAAQSLLDIGKRNMTNPKYDGFFEELTLAVQDGNAAIAKSTSSAPSGSAGQEPPKLEELRYWLSSAIWHGRSNAKELPLLDGEKQFKEAVQGLKRLEIYLLDKGRAESAAEPKKLWSEYMEKHGKEEYGITEPAPVVSASPEPQCVHCSEEIRESEQGWRAEHGSVICPENPTGNSHEPANPPKVEDSDSHLGAVRD